MGQTKKLTRNNSIYLCSSLIAAMRKGFFQSWPGLTEEAVHKHLPKSQATTMGYLDQTRTNKRSTQPTPGTSSEKECEPATTDSLNIFNTETTHIIFADKKMGRVYTDQTGRFPITSSKGNKYV